MSVIKKLLSNDKIRYLIAGGCTTLVNLITFFVLRHLTGIQRNMCNVIAILMAITFAYFANKFFVFRSRNNSLWENISEIISFIGARLISMMIELLGFALLADSFRMSEFWSKIFVQFIVVVMNYVLSRLFVFNRRRRGFKQLLRETCLYTIPFAIIFVVMVTVCISNKITPFGKNTLTLIDSLHQYLPFFGEYRDKLISEQSLFYTWNIALGSNFVSLFAYYLSSPFNYLFLLFPKMSIPAVITAIVILKLSISGSTMAYFLCNNGKYGKKNFTVIAISVCYALSNYVIGYGWNFMWLDCLMVFPLIMLGFTRLMEERKPNLYVLSLFYCLYCNYYIGFIICIFLVLWFLVYNHRSIKGFFADGVFFAFYSIISAGISAFLLIPAYNGIMMTASAGSGFPKKWNWYGNIFELLKQQFIMTKPIKCQTFDGGLNAYCGTFAVLAVFLFVFCNKIRLSERIGKLFLLLFLIVSFNSETLNFIWHGFHNQYGIPNRFSFLYIFVLLYMAYEVLKRAHKLSLLHIGVSGVFSIVFLYLVYKNASGFKNSVLIATAGLIFAYFVLLILLYGKALKKQIFAIAFTVVCAGELIVNAVWGYDQNGVSSFSYYQTTEAIAAANERIEYFAERDRAGFYRSELMKSKVLDEVTWHNMPSVGTFCSTVLGESTTTMGRLGFYTGANEFLYMGSTPFTNTLLNVRYLLKRPNDLNNFSFYYMDEAEGIEIYENPYPSAIGYAVLSEVKDWNRDGGMPITVQNSLMEKMTGIGDVFEGADVELIVASEDCEVSASGSSIECTPNKSGTVSFSVTFDITSAGDYYINCRGNGIYKLKIFLNGGEMGYDRYQSQIFHVGRLQRGDYVSIEYSYQDVSVGEAKSASLYAYTFDEERYEDVHERLTENLLVTDEYEAGYIHGTININSGETLFTTIPFDSGWRVFVDGKESSYYRTAGAFIGVDMAAGEHEIEFKYTPKGLYTGIGVSAYSLVLFLFVGSYKGGKKRKKTNKKLEYNDDNEIDRKLKL